MEEQQQQYEEKHSGCAGDDLIVFQEVSDTRNYSNLVQNVQKICQLRAQYQNREQRGNDEDLEGDRTAKERYKISNPRRQDESQR